MAILWYFGGLVPWSDFPSVQWQGSPLLRCDELGEEELGGRGARGSNLKKASKCCGPVGGWSLCGRWCGQQK